METTPPVVNKPARPPKILTKVMTTDPALTQVAAETVGKKLNKPAEKVTVVEAQEELKKMAEQMGSSPHPDD